VEIGITLLYRYCQEEEEYVQENKDIMVLGATLKK